MDDIMEQQKRDQFISGYIKRQEEMLLENLRARIEAEVNSSIRAAGLEQFEKDSTRLSLEMLEDRKIIGELREKNDKLQILCGGYHEKIVSLEENLKRLKILEADNATMKKNYDLLNQAFSELQETSKQQKEEYTFKYSDVASKKIALEIEHEKLLQKYNDVVAILEKNKKKQPTKKSIDWEDGSSIN